MKNYKVKTIVMKNFNDSHDNNKPYEKDEEIILNRARYEELLSKGIVEIGEKIIGEDKQVKKTFKKEED